MPQRVWEMPPFMTPVALPALVTVEAGRAVGFTPVTKESLKLRVWLTLAMPASRMPKTVSSLSPLEMVRPGVWASIGTPAQSARTVRERRFIVSSKEGGATGGFPGRVRQGED